MRPCAGGCRRQVRVSCDWCAGCVAGLLADVRRLQSLEPGQMILLADIFSTVGADTLTRCMIASLPFDDTPPDRRGMMQ